MTRQFIYDGSNGESNSNVVINHQLTYFNKNGQECGNPDTTTLNIKKYVRLIKSNIYPNPTNNLLNIECNYPVNSTIELAIYDNLGGKVLGKDFRIENRIEIDLRNFKNGIYHYTLFCPTQNLKSSGKFIKN